MTACTIYGTILWDRSGLFLLFTLLYFLGAVSFFLSYRPRLLGEWLMTDEAIRAVLNIVATGKEAIVKKEHGKWIVIENGRRLVYKEK